MCHGNGHYARDCWYKDGETANKPESPTAKAKAKAKGSPKKKAEKESLKAKERARGRPLLKSPKRASGMTTIWLEVNGTSLSQRPEWSLCCDLWKTY